VRASLKACLSGKNWGSELYGLDTASRRAEWLRDLFLVVTREWGFDYLVGFSGKRRGMGDVMTQA
jgi:hypothetical protein